MNITKKRSILTLYTILAFVIGIMLTVWRTVLLQNYYDPYDGTFDLGSGKIFITFEYLLLLSIVLISTAAFFSRKVSFVPFCKKYSTSSLALCVACGILLITVGLISLFAFSDELFFNGQINTMATKLGTILSFILMFFVSAYFFTGAYPKYKDSNVKTALAFITPIFVICYLVASYFNSDFVYNDFNRITCHISILAILFFSLSEAKLVIGKDGYTFNFIMSLICIVCIPSYIFPLIMLAAFGELSFGFTLFFEIFHIAFFIYAVASAVSALRSLSEIKEKTLS